MDAETRRAEIQRRLVLRLVGSPLTLLPVLGGAGVLLAPVFFAIPAVVPIAVGIGSMLLGGAGMGVRWVNLRERISQEVLDELEEEAASAQQAKHDALRDRLVADGDERTEALLGDVTRLVQAITTDKAWRDKVNVVAASDIVGGIDELYSGCVGNLERSAEIWEMASAMRTDNAREPLMAERERLIEEVEASVGSLTQLMTDLRVLGTEAASAGPDLARIQQNLKTSLAAARQTEREARSWSNDTAARRRKETE